MTMSFAARCCLAAAMTGALVVGVAPGSHAAITTYTNKADFLNALQPGYYSQPNMGDDYPDYVGGIGNIFTYKALVTTGIAVTIPPNNDLSTAKRNPSTIDFFFGPNIKAFGGYFYGNNFLGAEVASAIDFTLAFPSGIFAETLNSTSKTSFFGFISDEPLDSAVVSIPSANFVAAGTVIVGNTPPIVGSTPPVPGALPVVGIAAAFGWSRRLRQRLSAPRK
ncbi:MAG: hypothetical protein NT158_03540 [Cyanobacteria bacterium]|nr:hypothetical protein [Cyanobacteriota bacterium]